MLVGLRNLLSGGCSNMKDTIPNLDLFKAVSALQMSFSSPKDKIKKIYVNTDKRLVVVKWIDNTTTKVKCHPDDEFCVTIGVALAYCYKFFGSKNKFCKVISDLTKEVG